MYVIYFPNIQYKYNILIHRYEYDYQYISTLPMNITILSLSTMTHNLFFVNCDKNSSLLVFKFVLFVKHSINRKYCPSFLN